MAKITKPPIPMQMYRHFAAATIVLATAMAFLASENRSENEQRQATAASATVQTPRPSNTPAYGQAQLINNGGGSGSFGSEASPTGSFGRPSRRDGGNPFINSAQVPGANSENAGFTPSYLDRLTEEELDALLRGMREGGIESETERRQATAVMEAASRRRSGHGAGIG
jgi:hypothetical protein